MLLKNLFHQIISLAAWDRANSSVSVLDVIIVFCFIKCQSMGPLNSLNRYPSILYLVARSSVNTVLLIYTIWSSNIAEDLFKITEYSIAKLHVLYKYRIA